MRTNLMNALNTDDGFTPKEMQNILKIYESMSKAEKYKLNELFVNLCGFSFDTLLSETIDDD